MWSVFTKLGCRMSCVCVCVCAKLKQHGYLAVLFFHGRARKWCNCKHTGFCSRLEQSREQKRCEDMTETFADTDLIKKSYEQKGSQWSLLGNVSVPLQHRTTSSPSFFHLHERSRSHHRGSSHITTPRLTLSLTARPGGVNTALPSQPQPSISSQGADLLFYRYLCERVQREFLPFSFFFYQFLN